MDIFRQRCWCSEVSPNSLYVLGMSHSFCQGDQLAAELQIKEQLTFGSLTRWHVLQPLPIRTLVIDWHATWLEPAPTVSDLIVQQYHYAWGCHEL